MPVPDQEQHDNLRVQGIDPLIQPALLRFQLPLSEQSFSTISRGRKEAAEIVSGNDDRVLVIVGPCSIHDPDLALEYARLLKDFISQVPNLSISMRTYFEKPRTTVGWKGLINDPDLDGSFQINRGLATGRKVLIDITELGLPVSVELLDTISPQYIADCVSWGAIGARTTESQLHRELASGTSFPIGFKNGTNGEVNIAIDAMRASQHPHVFLGVDKQGLAGIVKTTGNPDTHIILRGGSSGPNYSSEFVQAARNAMIKGRPNQHSSVMIDCSHGNSQKDHRNQPKALASICDQLSKGDDVSSSIVGVMIESHINEGNQSIPPEGRSGLKYGVSVTDACVDWDTTKTMLKDLDAAVGRRRAARQNA